MKKNFFRLTLIASLLLHALGTAGLWAFRSHSSLLSRKQRPTEVELLSPEELLNQMRRSKEMAGQIVEQDEKSVNETKPEDSKYLSRKDQKVEKETRAAQHGKFQNAQATAGAPAPSRAPGAPSQARALGSRSEAKAERPNPNVEPTEKSKRKSALAARADGDRAFPSLDALKPKFNQYQPAAPESASGAGGGAQASATDDHLRAPISLQTMLSTREFVYYSYYNRIKDKLRQTWEPKIKEKMERIFRQGRTIASSADKITKVVILLDPKGTLVRVQIVGASGVTDLDDAAVEAFRAAAPFPNPPKGIVEPDGLIRIRWDFILEANANPASRFEGAS